MENSIGIMYSRVCIIVIICFVYCNHDILQLAKFSCLVMKLDQAMELEGGKEREEFPPPLPASPQPHTLPLIIVTVLIVSRLQDMSG